MRKTMQILVSVMLLLLVTGVVLAEDAPADPKPGDLLFHERFDHDSYSDAEDRVANNWVLWHIPGTHRPEAKQANIVNAFPDRVHTGDNAQQYFTFYRVHDAGVYTVIQVPPYGTVSASAYLMAWSSDEDDASQSNSAQNMHMRVGLDPDGGTDPLSDRVAWSEEINPLSTWQKTPAVEVQVGAGGMLTVFVRSTPKYPFKHVDCYVDDVMVHYVKAGVPGGTSAGTGTGRPNVDAVVPVGPPDPILEGLVGNQAHGVAGGWGGVEKYLAIGLLVAVVGVPYVLRRLRMRGI